MKKSLYPKTQRIKNEDTIITEKLDGSNLWFFKIGWELIIAQRNNVFKINELTKENSYKWLKGWLDDNKDKLDFCEWSWVFGEWIGIGEISYWESLDKKFYAFAKANIDENYDIRNLNYNLEFLKYPFESQMIPSCIGIVPKIEYTDDIWIESLNLLYEFYLKKVNRPVEWFIINNNNQISKYVRHKNWTLTPHKS